MITPILEKLILEGNAYYTTYAMGGSGVGTILVPEKSRVVLTDFIWSPFCDHLQGVVSPESRNNEVDAIWSTHNMKLRIQDREHHFCLRDSFSWNAPLATVGAFTGQTYFFNNHVQHHIFIAADENIQIDVFNFSPAVSWTVDFSALPENPSAEPTFPVGYGSMSVLRSIITPSGAQIIEASVQRDPTLPSPIFHVKNDFTDDIAFGINPLLDPTGTANPYGYPVITFGYVIMNETASRHFRT